MKSPVAATPQALISDICKLIDGSRAKLASVVNSALTLLYWHIGQRIRSEVLQGERAEYGEQIVVTLAKHLESGYGRGFSSKNLRHMLRFAEVFQTEQIVYALSRQLSWTHLRSLIYIDEPLKRDFYLQMCQGEQWSTRTLRERLDSLLFERTALSRQPADLLSTELANLRDCCPCAMNCCAVTHAGCIWVGWQGQASASSTMKILSHPCLPGCNH
jgi:hypothetical protein